MFAPTDWGNHRKVLNTFQIIVYALCAVCIHEQLSFLYAWASLKCICVFFIVARFHRNPHWPKAKYVTFSGPAGRLRLGRRCTICHESLQILAVIWDEVLIHSCLQGPEWPHTLGDIALVKTHMENISRNSFYQNKSKSSRTHIFGHSCVILRFFLDVFLILKISLIYLLEHEGVNPFTFHVPLHRERVRIL